MQADQSTVEYQMSSQVSPTKQARGDSGKEPKLHQVTLGGRQVANWC